MRFFIALWVLPTIVREVMANNQGYCEAALNAGCKTLAELAVRDAFHVAQRFLDKAQELK